MENKINTIVNWISKRQVLVAAFLAAGFIILTLGLGHISNQTIPGNVASARYNAEPGTHLDFMAEWDGIHYLHIAKHGYTDNSLVAFFPLYPLAIRLVMFLVSSPLISGLVVSWLALFGSLIFYLKILKEYFDNDKVTSVMGALLFLFFPTGVFLAATYSEGLFTLLALGALYFALKNRYILAGILTGLATATRPDGVFIILLVAAVLYEAKAKLWQILVAAGSGMVGLIGYVTYLGIKLHKPFAFISAQKHHLKWAVGSFIQPMINSLSPIALVLFILAIISTVYWYSRRKSFALYSLLFVLLPIVTTNFAGYPRYMLINFPLQIMLLNKFKRSTLAYSLVLVLSAILWGYFTMHYVAGYTGGS